MNLDIPRSLSLFELFYSTEDPEFKNLYEKEPVYNGESFGSLLIRYMIILLYH